jgi:hypothetical protein
MAAAIPARAQATAIPGAADAAFAVCNAAGIDQQHAPLKSAAPISLAHLSHDDTSSPREKRIVAHALRHG